MNGLIFTTDKCDIRFATLNVMVFVFLAVLTFDKNLGFWFVSGGCCDTAVYNFIESM